MSAARGHLHPRTPRERAALPRLPDGGQLRRLPCPAPDPWALRAGRRRRSGHHHRGLCPPGGAGTGASASTAPRRWSRPATAHAAEQHLNNLSFQMGNIYDLDFPDGEFDVVHAHQVLQHLTRSGGGAARNAPRGQARRHRGGARRRFPWHVAGTPQLPELDEWMVLYQELARHNRAEPDAGRRLVALGPGRGIHRHHALERQLALRHRRAAGLARGGVGRPGGAFGLRRAVPGLRPGGQGRLERISAGWRAWGKSPDGWFLIPNGEIIARV